MSGNSVSPQFQPVASSSRTIKVYQAGQRRGWGCATWTEMARELASSRELTWRLFRRDFSARYRQTALGVAWAVIMPVVVVGTFIFLNRSGVLSIGPVGIPYAAWALVGLTVWQIFAGGLVAASNAIISGGSMVVKISFPKETLVLASQGQTLVETGVRLLLVAILFTYYRVAPPPGALLFPLALAPLLLMTVGLGFLLSLGNALFRDVANIVTLATTFLMFLTPVLYPMPERGAAAVFMKYNPLSVLVAGPRELLIEGRLADPAAFAGASALAVAIFLVCWRVFHLAETRIAERVGGS